MSSGRHAGFTRAVVLSLLMMVMMTQVGYLESMNSWTSGKETLNESNDVLETGGSGSSNLTASVEGANLLIGEPMTNTTFQYNASAENGSGGGSGSSMTNVTGATCTVSPELPTGLNIDSSTCTISGTPTDETVNRTYTVTANISNVTHQGRIWLSTSPLTTSTDTDGDGVCDGPEAPMTATCTAGPDAFPLDPAAHRDTDGDGLPDELVAASTSQPPLVEDLDDDGDAWGDYDEFVCGTDSKDRFDQPDDTDGDGTCDGLDEVVDLSFTLTYATQYLDLEVNQTMEPFLPSIAGLGEVVTWELEGELPEGLVFGWSPARQAGMDGSLRGTPVNATDEAATLTVWANNSVYQQSFTMSLIVYQDVDNDSLPDALPENYLGNMTLDLDDDNDGYNDSMEIACGSDPYSNESDPMNDPVSVCLDLNAEAPDDDGVSWIWCFPCLLILLLVCLLPLLIGRDRLLMMMEDGPEPEHTTSKPPFTSGAGTQDDPFVLKPVKGLKAGGTAVSKELITITDMTVSEVVMTDLHEPANVHRFHMLDERMSDENLRILEVSEDGDISFNFRFDDSAHPTIEGDTYEGLLRLGKSSVYVTWAVTVKPDKNALKAAEKKAAKEAKKAEEKAAKEAKAAEQKAAKEEAAAKKK